MAADHFADMETQNAGDGLEVLVCASDQFIRRIGLRRIRPKDYDMRKHARRLSVVWFFAQVEILTQLRALNRQILPVEKSVSEKTGGFP
jgi:hypothetical protein